MPEIRNGRKRLCMWLDKITHAQAQYMANMAGQTLTEWVTGAIEQRLENDKHLRHREEGE